MAQATYSIRMDENLKTQFDELCANLGMGASTAFSIFARKAVRTRAIPFEVSESAIPSKRLVDLDTMDDERVFKELDRGMADYRAGRYYPAEETFDRVMEAVGEKV